MQFESFELNRKARIENVVVIVMHFKSSDQDWTTHILRLNMGRPILIRKRELHDYDNVTIFYYTEAKFQLPWLWRPNEHALVSLISSLQVWYLEPNKQMIPIGFFEVNLLQIATSFLQAFWGLSLD
jgi:hypothetical protein